MTKLSKSFFKILFTALVCCFWNSILTGTSLPSQTDQKVNDDVCYSKECSSNDDSFATNELNGMHYLLYDTSRQEGFNLRRDVYIRMAQLVLQLGDNWTLVLPPWGPLFHWQSKDKPNSRLPWSTFFQIDALQEVVPVIEFETFIDHVATEIDMILILNNYPDFFSNHDDQPVALEERYELDDCRHYQYYEEENGQVRGWFFGYSKRIWARKLQCAYLEGTVDTVAKLIRKHLLPNHVQTLMIQNAELMLHSTYGDAQFWLIRRSMRFDSKLINIADQFRKRMLNSDDVRDRTFIGDDWQLERLNKQKKPGDALGGNYVAMHFRRGDFKSAELAVSVSDAVEQAFLAMKLFNSTDLFVACDCEAKDWQQLKSQFQKRLTKMFESRTKNKNELTLVDELTSEEQPNYRLLRYQNEKLLDGQVAIVDQWICAHAKVFIGSLDSTFSLRIQEEREILGFHWNSTFNALCPNFSEREKLCEQSIKWKIVYMPTNKS